MEVDPFIVLGVPHTASAEQIAAAWRVLMRELHPDANASLSAAERSRLAERAAEANAAYNALKADLEGERLRHSTRTIAPRTSPSSTGPQWSPPPPMMPARIPGGWLFRRPLTWVLLALALVAGLVILNDIGSPRPARNPVTSTSYLPPVGWYAGNCLAGSQVVVPVRCTVDHSAKITAQVGATEYCPAGTDGTVFRDNVYFCVDSDQ